MTDRSRCGTGTLTGVPSFAMKYKLIAGIEHKSQSIDDKGTAKTLPLKIEGERGVDAAPALSSMGVMAAAVGDSPERRHGHGVYVNPGNLAFRRIAGKNYVDKTNLIRVINGSPTIRSYLDSKVHFSPQFSLKTFLKMAA